ncbi:MAG: tetratricopeptide repeat protein [Bacteroidetes bacterium]|nr:tetratricopeptide repeat protein [Bacteroidota bacterium]
MAEENLPDEIKKASAKLDNAAGIERFDLLFSLAKYYFNIKPRLAAEYAEEAKKIAQNENDIERLGKTFLILGKLYYRLTELLLAIECLSESARIAENLRNTENEIESLRMLGMTQNFAGDFSRALDSQFKSLSLCRKIGFKQGEGESQMLIALSYLGNKEINPALEYLEAAYKIKLEIGSKNDIAYALGNFGNAYLGLEQYEKAVGYFIKCKEILEEVDNKAGIGRASMNIGICLQELGKYEEGIEYVNKGLQIFLSIGEKEPISNCVYILGYIEAAQKKYEKAIEYYNEAIVIGEMYKLFPTLEQIYNSKSEAAAAIGDYKTAYEFYMKGHSLIEKRLKETAEFNTRYLSVAHRVDILQRESEILEEKNAKLNELNEKLTLLNDEKTEFLGIAAHDLKNPLNSISLSASTIKKYIDSFPKEKIENYLDKIEKTATRMKNIVTNLINTNIIETGRYNVKKQELDLNALVKHIAEDFKHQASGKNIVIVLNESEKIKIITDEDAIYSILDNLISNAVKYSLPGSEVKIGIFKNEKNVSVSVTDSGIGIKESEKDLVFTKFARMSNKPTAGENSTGLGLSIVKKLTELIGGRIFFKSEYGKGTTFTIELPL